MVTKADETEPALGACCLGEGEGLEVRGDNHYSFLILKAPSFQKCKSTAHLYNIWHPGALVHPLWEISRVHCLQENPRAVFQTTTHVALISSSRGRIGLNPEISSRFSLSQ